MYSWQTARINGTISVDPVRFPSGMGTLVKYVKSLGLSLGLYTSQSEVTCQARPGSYGYEVEDAAVYCELGAEYLKIDHCGGNAHPAANTSWMLFRKALDECAAK